MTNLLLLWDIDGTLTLSGGAGMRALETALQRGFGVERPLGDIDYAGRTDRWIARQIFRRAGLADTEANLARLLAGYLAELPGALHNPDTRVLPGVRAALDHLAGRPGCLQGLLTGNVERGAFIKLRHHGLDSYFAFGAYADDSEVRNDLGPIALHRARERLGTDLAADRVFLVGDTPHDIECGRIIGARTIAVATGGYSADALRACRPTAVLPDLGDTAAFLRLLEA